MRFSLLELLAVIGLISLGCIALKYASPIWSSILVTAIVALFSLSAFSILWHGSARHAPTLGFLIAGVLYFVLAFGPGFSDTVAPALPSGTLARDYLYPALSHEVPTSSRKLPDGTPVSSIRGGVTFVNIPFLPDFSRVSHALGILLAGLLGAAAARWYTAHSDTTR